LGDLPAREIAANVWKAVSAKCLFGKASELAFDFLFALFPLILFMVTLFGLFAGRTAELQHGFLAYFADLLPPLAFQLLQKTTTELAASAGGGKLTFGILVSAWFASGGVASMISALNVAYSVRETRSWLRVRTAALALTVSIAIFLLVALLLVFVSERALDWIGSHVGLHPLLFVLWRAFRWPGAIFFVLVSYWLIYFFGPNLTERRWMWTVPGSVFGAAVWLAASAGFRIYLHFFNTYSATYGSLGAVMILLAWLYLTALAFLIGGEINAEMQRAEQNAPYVGMRRKK